MTFSVCGRCVKNLPNKDGSAARTSLLWHCPAMPNTSDGDSRLTWIANMRLYLLGVLLESLSRTIPPPKKICYGNLELQLRTNSEHSNTANPQMVQDATNIHCKKVFFKLPLSSTRLTSFDAKSLQAREKPARC